MKMQKMLLTLIVVPVLTGCGSSFTPINMAPTDTPVLVSPIEIPASISKKRIVWYGGLLDMSNDSGKIAIPFSEDTDWPKLSNNGQYMAFLSKPINMGTNGLPITGDEIVRMLDIHTTEMKTLISKAQSFPDAVSFETPTITPDDRSMIFVVDWKSSTDLVKVVIADKHAQRLNVDVLLTNFGHPDVSSKGEIVVICKGPEQNTISELCLLDENGKFIRYLTSEGYPWPGYGLFTPDGQYVVYESRYKLYKVRVDGSERQQIAPCAMLGPALVTDDYVVTQCYVSQEPDCYGLFIADLNGSDFRRIGYVDAVCNDN